MDEEREFVKENVRSRILSIMEREGLNAGAFATSINVAQATISQLLRGRNMPSTDVLIKLHQRYPDINLDWLITGEGSMTNRSGLETPVDSLKTSETENESNISGYPLFAENQINLNTNQASANNRKEMALENLASNKTEQGIRQNIIYKEMPPKKITEIRIFFEDNTFQVFKPEK